MHRHRTVSFLYHVLLIVLLSLVSTTVFALTGGLHLIPDVVRGVLIPFPQTVCLIALYSRRAADVRRSSAFPEKDAQAAPHTAELADVQEPPVCVSGEKTQPLPESGRSALIREACAAIQVRMRLFTPVLEALTDSVSTNLSSTTEPISAELLRIRQSSASFLEGIREYEAEIRSRTVVQNLENEGAVFERELTGLVTTVDCMFCALETYFGKLESISNRIGGTAESISELSEQIRVLSFNASIEAARAGQAGAGFRIIAGEIKRLSSGTDERSKEIARTLSDTYRLFGELKAALGSNRKEILTRVSERRSSFGVFRKTLENYYPRLEQLYAGVTKVIDSLSESMNVISPVVQLHEITSQEIGNMKLVVTDLCRWAEQTAQAGGGRAGGIDSDTACAAAAEIRGRLTTERELEALGRGIRKTVPGADLRLGINNQGIELF